LQIFVEVTPQYETGQEATHVDADRNFGEAHEVQVVPF